MTSLLKTLTNLATKDLQARFQTAFGKATPSRNRPWLIKRLAAAATAPAAPRRARRAASQPAADAAVSTAAATVDTAAATPAPAVAMPPIGAEIRKTWRGRELVVTVVEGGFRLDGTTYTSLSAAATALCGGNRNGLVFFGLKPRPISQRKAGAA